MDQIFNKNFLDITAYVIRETLSFPALIMFLAFQIVLWYCEDIVTRSLDPPRWPFPNAGRQKLRRPSCKLIWWSPPRTGMGPWIQKDMLTTSNKYYQWISYGFFKHNYLSNNFRLVSIPRPGFELESLCPEELNDWAYLVSKGLALDWEFFHWFVITIWSKFHIGSSNIIMGRAYYSHHNQCSFFSYEYGLNQVDIDQRR